MPATSDLFDGPVSVMLAKTQDAVVAMLAFVAPLAVRVIRLPVPYIMIQILLGVAAALQSLVGRVDQPVQVFALIGPMFLPFAADVAIDLDRDESASRSGCSPDSAR